MDDNQQQLFVTELGDQTLHDGHYVYLVQAENTDIYKIGMSNNPSRRLSELKRDAPTEVKDKIRGLILFATFKASNEYVAEVLERSVQNELRAYMIEGDHENGFSEWFWLDQKIIKPLIAFMNDKALETEKRTSTLTFPKRATRKHADYDPITDLELKHSGMHSAPNLCKFAFATNEMQSYGIGKHAQPAINTIYKIAYSPYGVLRELRSIQNTEKRHEAFQDYFLKCSLKFDESILFSRNWNDPFMYLHNSALSFGMQDSLPDLEPNTRSYLRLEDYL